MNDNNNFPRNSKSNNKLPEGWGNSKNGDTKASPWENKPKTTAWENSPQTSPWGTTNNNSENRPSKSQNINTENVNAAINKFAGMAKRAGERAVSTAADAAKNAADYAKSDAVAEKMNAAKNKAQALASSAGSKLSDIKNKASDKISEHKNKVRSSDENISAADEYDSAENFDVSSGENVYQNNEDNTHDADDPIASDDTSSEDDTNENSSSAPVGEITSNKNEEQDKSGSADENISAANEHDPAESLDVSSDDNVYQNNEENAHDADDPIASDDTSSEDDTNEKSSPAPVREKEARSHAAPPFAPQNRNNQQTQRPVSQSQSSFPQTQRPVSQSQRPFPQSQSSFPQSQSSFPQSQRPVSQPQNPVSPQSSAPGYAVQTQKTNPVLIIVIIVLVLIVGVLGGMFFMMNRKDNNEPVESGSKVSDNSEESENSEDSTKFDTTTTESADEPTEPTIASADEVNRAAKKIINDLPKDYEYSLYDVNGDGVLELFVSYMSIAGDCNYILHYYDSSEFKELKEFWGSLSICPDSHYIKEINYGGAEVFIYYELTKDNQLNKLDEIYCSPDYEYYRNGQKIPNSEYYAAISYYNDMNWIDIKSPSINVAPTEKDKIPSAYKGYENIENAPADMEFYDVNKTVKGYVKTESTGLNMRAGAGTDYKVAHEIPRGAEVEIIGANSEWYYVKYFSGGTGAFAVDFYGFVSSQYISTTPVVNEAVDVYSCKSLGRLNTRGLGVAGFATSYVVDGGEVSEVRHTLGDGWHVTAVNWCYSRDVLWYELYDSDDGDYYGWVDVNYIDFY